MEHEEDGQGDMDKRIPSLDGARAVSITLVFASHLVSVYDTPIVWRFDYGNLGVRIFFVISGFLITSILLAERERTGHIRLIEFYIRRAFRIVPAYYTSLALIVYPRLPFTQTTECHTTRSGTPGHLLSRSSSTLCGRA
jgi:peptidoglycan/LPS O-acetylase OafA/YrhL